MRELDQENGADHLMKIYRGNDIEKLTKALEQKSDLPLTQDSDGYTLAHHAAFDGKLAVLKLLLAQNPELLRIANAQGRTPLHLAAHNGHLSTISDLLTKESLWDRDENGMTPPLLAAQVQDTKSVQACIAVDPNILLQVSNETETLACMAAHMDNFELLKVCVNAGKENGINVLGNQHGVPCAIKMVPEHLFGLQHVENGQVYFQIASPAALAASCGNEKSFAYCLAEAKDQAINILDYRPWSPVCLAVKHNRLEIVKMCLNSASDTGNQLQATVLAGNNNETCPARMALEHGNLEMLCEFTIYAKKHRLDLIFHTRTENIFITAARLDRPDIFEFLLTHFPWQYSQAKDESDNTPAMIAVQNGNADILQLCINHTDQNRNSYHNQSALLDTNRQYATPVTMALKLKQQECIDVIRKRLLLPMMLQAQGRDINLACLVHNAIQEGNEHKLEDYLTIAPDILSINTPAVIAAEKNQLACLNLCIDFGEKNGLHVLEHACDSKYNFTPAHAAADRKNLEALKMCIDRAKSMQADIIHSRDRGNRTIALLCMQNNFQAGLQYLLQQYPEVLNQYTHNQSVACYAAKDNWLSIREYKYLCRNVIGNKLKHLRGSHQLIQTFLMLVDQMALENGNHHTLKKILAQLCFQFQQTGSVANHKPYHIEKLVQELPTQTTYWHPLAIGMIIIGALAGAASIAALATPLSLTVGIAYLGAVLSMLLTHASATAVMAAAMIAAGIGLYAKKSVDQSFEQSVTGLIDLSKTEPPKAAMT